MCGPRVDYTAAYPDHDDNLKALDIDSGKRTEAGNRILTKAAGERIRQTPQAAMILLPKVASKVRYLREGAPDAVSQQQAPASNPVNGSAVAARSQTRTQAASSLLGKQRKLPALQPATLSRKTLLGG